MQPIDRQTLKRWLDERREFTLVEVLAPEKYREFHLPGAINVPLGDDLPPAATATEKARSRRRPTGAFFEVDVGDQPRSSSDA